MRVLRGTVRTLLVLTLLPAIPLLAIPQPGQARAVRWYCWLVLRCMGVRITKSGGPIRNVPGVLVVSPHMSWVDALVIYALMPGTFVAKAELIGWPGLGLMARLMKVIPIDRAKLRRLPDVVGTVAERLRVGPDRGRLPRGHHLVRPWRRAVPACDISGRDRRRATRAAAAAELPPSRRPPSTMPAYVGDDTLVPSFRRVLSTRLTVAHVQVEELQLPGEDRRDLSRRCEAAVGATAATCQGAHEHALAA